MTIFIFITSVSSFMHDEWNWWQVFTQAIYDEVEMIKPLMCKVWFFGIWMDCMKVHIHDISIGA